MNSLIRYLDPAGQTFYLNLSDATKDGALPEESRFPFAVVSDADPLARLVEAQLVSDAGSEVKKLFCFVQRDACLLKNQALWPFTNSDIVNAWQKSFAFYADTKRSERSFVLLSDQLGKRGDILPFASLLYCKIKKAFFSPPCPKCGQVLQQCEDDELLKASGLSPFSTSLKRYLYCPSCKAPDYYVSERALGDPPCVYDRQALMTGFGELKKVADLAAFPCADCSFHEECYETGHRVRERMVPFSFYPFYLLAFEAASLCAPDFIALLSGADFQEIQSKADNERELGRAASLKTVSRACAGNRPFLFDHDDRHFLEILYLKLTFLEEVLRNFQSGGQFAHPGMNPGMDQIWVTFPEQSGLLPFFWNFKTRFLGVGKEESNPLSPGAMPDFGVLWGMIWFYALLTNMRQGMSEILTCLKKYAPEGPASFEKMAEENIFDPLNIFWDPQDKTVHAAWKDLWERALKMGWSLAASSRESAESSGEKFLEQLVRLRQDIKENLLIKEMPRSAAAPAPKTVEAAPPATKDEAIHNILLGLIDKLQSVEEAKPEPPALNIQDTLLSAAPQKEEQASVPPLDEDLEEPVTETVVFSARTSTKEAKVPSVQETMIIAQDMPSQEVPMEDQETLILSVKDLEAQAKPKAGEADKLDETLILSVQPSEKVAPAPPQEKTQKVSPTVSAPEVLPDIEETVILSVRDLESRKKTEPPKTGPALEETVILSAFPPASKEMKSSPAEAPPGQKRSADLLEETVILRPGEKSKDGAKK